jgi:ABC-type transport system involved in multi-copper enzyme maturation permease subunit
MREKKLRKNWLAVTGLVTGLACFAGAWVSVYLLKPTAPIYDYLPDGTLETIGSQPYMSPLSVVLMVLAILCLILSFLGFTKDK